MMIRVRAAQLGDALRIVEMTAAVSAHEGLDPPAVTAEGLARCAFEEGLLEMWVAESDGALVGHVVTTRSFDMQRGAPVRWICDLYVEPGFRGRGVGRRLIGAVSERALSEGAEYLQWLIAPDNALAERFYTGLGARRDAGVAMFLRREEMLALKAEVQDG